MEARSQAAQRGHRSLVIAFAGPIASGKSTVASLVASELEGVLVAARTALLDILNLSDPTRTALQREGADLDRRTAGRWLSRYLLEEADKTASPIVVDGLRTIRQAQPVLSDVPGTVLVYLRASETVRRIRYSQSAQSDPVKRGIPFDQAMAHETERSAHQLASIADFVIETDDHTPGDTASEVLRMISHVR